MIQLEIETPLMTRVAQIATSDDPAHDFSHFQRVVNLAKKMCASENAIPEIVVPAAWLHDFVNIPKGDPRRKQASQISAAAALKFLGELNYPQKYFAGIAHAIEAHSFSANIEATTLEAKIVQDADRLDGLGAIGIARCFATASLMRTPFYSELDPFCKVRTPDDRSFATDHFYNKLFKVADSLKTKSGRAEGVDRASAMRQFLAQLGSEIASTDLRAGDTAVNATSVGVEKNKWVPPVLETARLRMRPVCDSDAADIFEYAKNPNVSKHTLWEPHTSIEMSHDYIRDYILPKYELGLLEPLGIELKTQPGKIIGTVGCFWTSKISRSMELAYAIDEKHWGKGIVAEASSAVMEFCFREYGLKRLHARCKSQNKQSSRVMQKIGMLYEGTLRSSLFYRGEFHDMDHYAKISET